MNALSGATEHRYRLTTVLPTLIGSASAALALAALASLPNHWQWLQLLEAGLAVLFAYAAWRQLRLTRVRVCCAAETVTAAGQPAFVWHNLSGLSLSFYNVRRGREHGWLELTLRFGARRLHLDSRIDEFDVIVTKAVEMAVAQGLALSQATRENLQDLGYQMVGEFGAQSEVVAGKWGFNGERPEGSQSGDRDSRQ